VPQFNVHILLFSTGWNCCYKDKKLYNKNEKMDKSYGVCDLIIIERIKKCGHE
jgi:hypothetical protein